MWIGCCEVEGPHSRARVSLGIYGLLKEREGGNIERSIPNKYLNQNNHVSKHYMWLPKCGKVHVISSGKLSLYTYSCLLHVCIRVIRGVLYLSLGTL